MEELTIVLTVAELDYVCNAVADRPFREVNGLLAKIVNQANAQRLPIPPELKPLN